MFNLLHINLFKKITIGCACVFISTLAIASPLTLAFKEKQLAAKYEQELQQSGMILEDVLAADYIRSVGNRLIAATPGENHHFHFYLLNRLQINAFAGPEGIIGVNAGLLLAVRKEEELAAVLAHEIAHVHQGHLQQQWQNAHRSKLWQAGGLIAALAVAPINPGLASGVFLTALAGAAQQQINFTRAQESEADRVGMQILIRSGYDPKAMGQFFRRLAQEERLHDRPPELLSSHPYTEHRMADIASQTIEKPHTSQTHADFYLAQVRVQLATSDDLFALSERYQVPLPDNLPEKQLAQQYGLAITQIYGNQQQQGYQLLSQLAEQHPQILLLPLTQARAALYLDKPGLAVELFAQLQKNHPDNLAVIASAGEALLASNQPKEAEQLLQGYLHRHPGSLIPFNTLARAQAKLGLTQQAYQTRAQYFLTQGAWRDAIVQFEKARELSHNDLETQQALNAQIAALHELVNKSS